MRKVDRIPINQRGRTYQARVSTVRKGSRRGSPGRVNVGGRRFITGIKIPEGGITNLIKKKTAVDERATGLYNFGRQETALTAATTMRLSTASSSSNFHVYPKNLNVGG